MKYKIFAVIFCYCWYQVFAVYNVQPLPSPTLIQNENLILDLAQYYTGVNISFTSNDVTIPPKINNFGQQNTDTQGEIIDFAIQTDILGNWILPGLVAVLNSNNTVYWDTIQAPNSLPTFTSARSKYLNGSDLNCFSLDIYNSTMIVLDCQDNSSDYLIFIDMLNTNNVFNTSALPQPENEHNDERNIFVENLAFLQAPSAIIRYVPHCENSCFVQILNVTDPTNVNQIRIYNGTLKSLNYLQIQDVKYLYGNLYILDPQGYLYQLSIPASGKPNITSQQLAVQDPNEVFHALNFYTFPFNGELRAGVYILSNLAVYQYFMDQNFNILFTQGHEVLPYITNVASGKIRCTDGFGMAQVTAQNGSQVGLIFTHKYKQSLAELYLVYPLSSSISIMEASPNDNIVIFITPFAVYGAQINLPKVSFSSQSPGTRTFNLAATDLVGSQNFQVRINVIQPQNMSIIVSQDPTLPTNYSSQASQNITAFFNGLFEGPFMNINPTLAPTIQQITLLTNFSYQPSLMNFMTYYHLASANYIWLTQTPDFALTFQQCALSGLKLSCSIYAQVTTYKCEITNMITAPTIFAFTTKDVPQIFQIYYYYGYKMTSITAICEYSQLVQDPNFPYLICGWGKSLTLYDCTSANSFQFNMSAAITNIAVTRLYIWTIFVQTGNQMNLLYLQSLLNGSYPILSSFEVSPNSYPIITGNSIVMVGDNIIEYDLTDLYNVVQVKTYSNMMKYNNLSSTLNYLRGSLGLFYLVGNVTTGTGNSLNATVIQTGRMGQNNWLAMFPACPIGSDIYSISSSAHTADSEILFIHCGNSSSTTIVTYMINNNPALLVSRKDLLGTSVDVYTEQLPIQVSNIDNYTNTRNISFSFINNQPQISVVSTQTVQINATGYSTYTYNFLSDNYFQGVIYGYNVYPQMTTDLTNFQVLPLMNQNMNVNYSLQNPMTDAYFDSVSDTLFFLTPQALFYNSSTRLYHIPLTDQDSNPVDCSRLLIIPGGQKAIVGCNNTVLNGVFVYSINMQNQESSLVGTYYANNIMQMRLIDNYTVAVLTDNNQLYVANIKMLYNYLVNRDEITTGFLLPVDFDVYCTNLTCFFVILDASGTLKTLFLNVPTNQIINSTAYNLNTVPQFLADGLSATTVNWIALTMWQCSNPNNCSLIISAQNFMTYLITLNSGAGTITVVQAFQTWEATQPVGNIHVDPAQGIFAYTGLGTNVKSHFLVVYSIPQDITQYQKSGPIGTTTLTYRHPYVKPYLLTQNQLWVGSSSYLYNYNLSNNPSISMNFSQVTSTYLMFQAYNVHSQAWARIDLMLPPPTPTPQPTPPAPNSYTWLIILIIFVVGAGAAFGVYKYKKRKVVETDDKKERLVAISFQQNYREDGLYGKEYDDE